MYTSHQAQIAVIILTRAGQIPQARQIIKQAELDVQPDLHCILAADYAEKKQYDAALREYQAALKISPSFSKGITGSVELYTVLAVDYLGENDWDQALNCVKKALRLDPQNKELLNLSSTIEITKALEGGNADDPGVLCQAIEKIYLANPGRLELAHKLGMLYHQSAIELEENPNSGLVLLEAWEKAIAYWALVAEGDGYWEQWFMDRERVYGQPVPPDKREELRQSKIKEHVRQVHQNYIREYHERGKKEHADRHRNLLARWSLELATADATRRMLDYLRKHNQPLPLPAACGPIGWEIFNAREEVEKAALQVKKMKPGDEAAQTVQESLTPVGMARIMYKDGLLAEAVDILEKYSANARSDQAAKDLLVEMLDKLGQTLIESDPPAGIEAWLKAKKFGANAKEIDEKIAQAVYNRASRQAEQGDIQAALTLLERGIRSISSGTALLKDLYAQIVNREAVKMVEEAQKSGSNSRIKKSMEEARALLVKADRVVGPNHPKIKENLQGLDQLQAGFLTGPAIDKANKAIQGYSNGTRGYDATIRDLDEALSMLEEAARTAPNSDVIRKHINDLRGVRDNIRSNEAGRLNQLAVELANNAAEAAKRGQRYQALEYLNQAIQHLTLAKAMAPYDSTIEENYNQINILRNMLLR